MHNEPIDTIADVADLEDRLSSPTPALVEAMSRPQGDLLVLGAAGKMGPTLARMARRAFDQAGVRRRVIGVSRFSEPGLQARLESWGVQTVAADLLDPAQVAQLPDVPNVVFMAGMKFGSTGNQALTWAMNVHLPALVAQKFRQSRIVAFGTGNVYGLSPIALGGSLEPDPLNPTGEYAMSCVGRERMFEHFSRSNGTKVSLVRLNYACELRYGVLVDLARKVWEGRSVDLSMGAFNAIWQADANAAALRSFEDATSPPLVLNVAGPETLSVRRVCQQFGELFGKPVVFEGSECSDALLSNGQRVHALYGYPEVPAGRLIQWVADWVSRGGALSNKPTHFEARDGRF
jgi:nucleoside-diphosphate-sugar epimerase